MGSYSPGNTAEKKWQFKTFLFLACLHLLFLVPFVRTYANTVFQAITLSEKNAPIERVFRAIEKQTGFYFIYNAGQVKQANPVTIDVSHATLEQTLAICFKNQPFAYTVVDNLIVVKPLIKHEIAAATIVSAQRFDTF